MEERKESDMKKRVLAVYVCFCMVLSLCGSVNYKRAEAKATKAAMKFLKGVWVTAGQSASVRVVFTRKYVKFYDCWNKSHTKVYDDIKKAKYMGRQKIISTKKKGKEWHIKVKSKNGVYYYVGSGDGLLNRWWENGEWQYSYSSSLERDSGKSSTKKKAKKKKKKVSLASVKNDYLTLYYELQEDAEARGKGEEMYYSYIKVPGEKAPYLIMKRGREEGRSHIWLKHYTKTRTLEFDALEVMHAGNYVICYIDKGLDGMEAWAYKLKGGKIKLYKHRKVFRGSVKQVTKKFQKWVGKNFKSRKRMVFDEPKWKQG